MAMNRKKAALICCTLSVGAQFDFLHQHHIVVADRWRHLLFAIPAGLLLPGGVVAVVVRDLTGALLPLPIITLLSLAVWFFPSARILRSAGMHDAFAQSKSRWPSLTRGAATVLDTLNRLRVGKGKMGGWA